MLRGALFVMVVLIAACGGEPATAAPGKASASKVDEWAESDALKAKLAPDVAANLRDLWSSRVVKVTPVDAPYLAKAKIYRGERRSPACSRSRGLPGVKVRIRSCVQFAPTVF